MYVLSWISMAQAGDLHSLPSRTTLCPKYQFYISKRGADLYLIRAYSILFVPVPRQTDPRNYISLGLGLYNDK